MSENKIETLRWVEDHLEMIDQRILPADFQYISYNSAITVANGIRSMVVRGAPAIGCAAAYGVALEALNLQDASVDEFSKGMEQAFKILLQSRPTAINLFWAIDRMRSKMNENISLTPKEIANTLLSEAHEILSEDIEINRKMGSFGAELLPDGARVLTHCNAGWLATIDWGTATSPIYHAHKKGIKVHVWVDETRPRNQGASLTSYELNEEGVPNTIIADNTGGILMQRGEVDMCIVGTDRTIATGDVANKIGTYLKALAAKDNNVPFYVALPSSTIDWETKDFKDIPIEERNSEELSYVEGLDKNNEIKKILIYPKKSKTMNLAFDVTPAKYVTGLITEKGVCEASSEGLKELFK